MNVLRFIGALVSAVVLLTASSGLTIQPGTPSIPKAPAPPVEIPPKVDHPDFSKLPLYEVVSIADGDTVTLKLVGSDKAEDQKVHVRLVGVDTPETKDPRKPVQEFGAEASAFTTNLLSGEKVYAEPAGGAKKVDQYGRSLFYLYRSPDGLFVNLEIVRQGYGHAMTEYPHKNMEAFRWYEKKAREASKGLWSGKPLVKPGEQATPPAAPVPAAASPDTKAPDQQQIRVYGTKTGSKYHRASCSYLNKSSIPMTLEEAKKKGLTPCSKCSPPN